MDDRSPSTTSSDNWSQDFATALSQRRERAQNFLDEQRAKLSSLEMALAEQVQQLSGELADEQSQCAGRAAELDERAAQLANKAEALARLNDEVTLRQSTWEELQGQVALEQAAAASRLATRDQELARREERLGEREASLRQSQRDWSMGQEDATAERDRLARQKARLDEQAAELEGQRDKLSAEQLETKAQRRRIARELQDQRAALREERERSLAEVTGERARAEELLADARRLQSELAAERERLQAERSAVQVSSESQQREMAEARAQLARAGEEQTRLKAEGDRLVKELERRGSQQHEDDRAAAIQGERDELLRRLAEAEAQIARQGKQDGDSRKMDDMQRRFELAVEDVRDLKRRNSELEAKLAEAASKATRAAPTVATGALDWEAQKRRLLEELEADHDENEDDDEREERLTIEGTIRITDEVVTRKDQEIAELKRVLEDQSASIGSVAVGAAAVDELLNGDELIRQERGRLSQLQTEWEEKLRKAEIDLSVERAKMARERAAMEEQLQVIKTAQANLAGSGGMAGAAGDKSAKLGRGRWLARLGLKDE